VLFVAVDITSGDAANDPFCAAFKSDIISDHSNDYYTTREFLAGHGRRKYTMVAYNTEQVITRLLYRNRENVRVYYREDTYTYGEWWFDDDSPPMQIWDIKLLAGGMSMRELCECTGVEQYELPQRYTAAYKRRWKNGCAFHMVPSCPECWGVIERALWRCAEHDIPECESCYRLRNAEAIYRYVERYAAYAESHNVTPSRTIGGMALKLWRSWDNPEPIRLPRVTMDGMARKAYYGGRTECLKIGSTGPVTYGDVRAMYGSVMQDVELPTPDSMVTLSADCSIQVVYEQCGASECTVRVPEMYVPPLPYRWNGMIVYPTGTFRGWWPHVELRHAIDCGVEILERHQSLYGTDTVKPFAIFAGGLLELRQEFARKHDSMEQVAKLMLNSLYGYIGMKSEWDSAYIMPLPPGTSARDWPHHEVQVLKGHVLLRREDHRHGRSQWSNPLWAAIITATARVKLHRYMLANQAGLCYVDTDSIITMGELVGTGVGDGELQHVGLYDSSWIVAPKIYRLETAAHTQRVAAAGIPRWQLDALINGTEYRDGHAVGIMEGFWTGIEPGRYVRYHATRQYDTGKRHLLNEPSLSERDGWSDTSPLRMAENLTA
jgi:DNA polymerase type B, organellar and viral